jgi:hypothetical protein
VKAAVTRSREEKYTFFLYVYSPKDSKCRRVRRVGCAWLDRLWVGISRYSARQANAMPRWPCPHRAHKFLMALFHVACSTITQLLLTSRRCKSQDRGSLRNFDPSLCSTATGKRNSIAGSVPYLTGCRGEGIPSRMR